MRQSFIVIFIFFTFLFVIGYFPIDFSNRLQPELFIDHEAVIVNKNFNFLERVHNFQETPLAETLLNLDYSLISTVLNIPDFDPGEIKEWQEKFQSLIGHPLVVELFGSEFTVALFPYENKVHPEEKNDLLKSLLIVARPRHHARIIEIFSDLIDTKDSVTEARYGGYIIKRIPIENGHTVAVTRVKDLLLMSLDERTLRKSLDVYDQNISLFTEVKDYRRASKKFENCSSLTYVNVSNTIERIHGSIAYTGADNLLPGISERLKKFNGYKHLIWGTWDNKDFLSQKAIISFNRDEILPEYQELFRIKPSKSDIYKRINADTIWYYWTNILKPKALLALYNHGIDESGDGGNSRYIQEIAETTGLSTEELFSLVGNDFLIAIKNSPEEQFIPIPHLLLALKTSNPEKLLTVIETITDYYDIPLTKQSIKGLNLYLWGGVIPTGDLQPAFCISDNYLILSSNRQQINEFIGAGNGYRSLASNPDFQQVENGLTDENNSINYIDSKNLTLLIKEVFSWIGTMIAIQDREAAQRSKILIDKLINPLLDGLAMYSTIGMRSYTEEDSIIIESKVMKNYGNE
jgi:hypothetical protein